MISYSYLFSSSNNVEYRIQTEVTQLVKAVFAKTCTINLLKIVDDLKQKFFSFCQAIRLGSGPPTRLLTRPSQSWSGDVALVTKVQTVKA